MPLTSAPPTHTKAHACVFGLASTRYLARFALVECEGIPQGQDSLVAGFLSVWGEWHLACRIELKG